MIPEGPRLRFVLKSSNCLQILFSAADQPDMMLLKNNIKIYYIKYFSNIQVNCYWEWTLI